MSILDWFFAIFLCLTREDKTGDRHKRAAAFLEMISTFLLSFFTMLIFGILNLRMTNFILWIIVIAFHGIISYLLLNKYFIKSEKHLVIKKITNQYSKRTKIAYAFIAALLVLFSFGLLICGGVLMSFLLSIH